MAGIYKLAHRETVTLANMKISSVALGAFIDFSNSETAKLIDHLGYLIKIRDSAGRALQGFGMAAGTVETLGSELVGSWTNNAFDTFVAAGTDITSAIALGGGVHTAYDIITEIPPNSLVKETFTFAKTSGAFPVTRGGGDLTLGGSLLDYTPIVGANTNYKTLPTSYVGLDTWGFRCDAATNFQVSGYSLKLVTAPSASGITISSTKGGATQSFAQKDASFNYADATGYTVEYWKVNNAVQVDSDAVTNANATLVLTDGSAAWSAVGLDDSAFQTGKHAVAIYDSTGVMVAWGFYKSAGAGAVVSTHGGATQNWTHIGTGSVAGDFVRKVFYVGAP